MVAKLKPQMEESIHLWFNQVFPHEQRPSKDNLSNILWYSHTVINKMDKNPPTPKNPDTNKLKCADNIKASLYKRCINTT